MPQTETEQPAMTAERVFQRLDTTARAPYTLQEYARRFAWEWVQRTLIRYSFRKAEGWRRFWLRVFGATISGTCKIKPTTRIFHPWLLTLGEYSVIADEVDVYNLGPVEIGDHSVVSHRATLCAGTHDYTQPDLPLRRPAIRIGRGVWVCTQAFIGPGVRVGDNAIVGACAVVVKDVGAGKIVAGNPARVVGDRPEPGIGPGVRVEQP